MATSEDLEDRFWKALESDKTMMLGIDGAEDGHTRPMTAQVQNRKGPIWFVATFASKGHEFFAALQGTLNVETDAAVVVPEIRLG